MPHCRLCGKRIIRRIIVPGDDVHLLCPFEIVQSLVGSHQIGGYHSFRIMPVNDIPFQLIAVQIAVRNETAVIQGNSREIGTIPPKTVPQRIGENDFIPVIKRVSPEFHVPGFVYRFNGFVPVLQPDAECILADIAVAFVTEFIIDMPAGDMGIMRIFFRQPFDKRGCEMPVYRRIGAGVVSAAEFMTPSFIIGMHDFRVSFDHPGRKRCGGGGHDDVIVFL